MINKTSFKNHSARLWHRIIPAIVLICIASRIDAAHGQEEPLPNPELDSFDSPDDPGVVPKLPEIAIELPQDGELVDLVRSFAEAFRKKHEGVSIEEPGSEQSSHAVFEAELRFPPDTEFEEIERRVHDLRGLGVTRFRFYPALDEHTTIIITNRSRASLKSVNRLRNYGAQESLSFDVRVRQNDELPTSTAILPPTPIETVPGVADPVTPALRVEPIRAPVISDAYAAPASASPTPVENVPALPAQLSPAAPVEPIPAPVISDEFPAHLPLTPRGTKPGASISRATKVEEQLLKIFHLQYAEASDMGVIIQQLFEDRGITLAADERTNSLMIRGNADVQNEIEALLLKLDDRPAPVSAPQANSFPVPDPEHRRLPPNPVINAIIADASTAELRGQYESLENAAQKLAEQVRSAVTTLGKNHPETEKRKADLRAAVQQAFAARQELQRAELAEFARRMQRMHQSIDMRYRIADQIIDRRVEELLDSNLKWEPSENEAAVVPANAVSEAAPVRSDPELEGVWEQESINGAKARVSLQASLTSTTWTWIHGGPRDSSTIEINAGTSPKTIDLITRGVDGKEQSRKKGIYEIRDGKLRLGFPAREENGNRPRDLSSNASAVSIWKRIGDVPASQLPTTPPQHATANLSQNEIHATLISKIRPQDWGEPNQGLRLAVVPASENSPADEAMEVLLVLKNESQQDVTLNDTGWYRDVKCTVRLTSGAQVRTQPIMDTGRFQPRTMVLTSGQTTVIGIRRIRVFEGIIPNDIDADLVITDPKAFEFRNAIYTISCELRAELMGDAKILAPLHSGTIAIAFSRPANSGVSQVDSKSRPSTAPEFRSPKVLLDYMTKCGTKEDFAAYVELLTDDEAKRFAGLMLQSAQTCLTVSGIAASASGESTEKNPNLAAYAGIHSVLQSSVRSDASPEADSAFNQLMSRAMLAIQTSGSQSPPVMKPDEYSQLLKTAAGVLKDDRIFAAEILKALSALNQRPLNSKAVSDKPQWNIVIDGDVAVATETRQADNPSEEGMPLSPIELQRTNGYWKISKLFSDETISELSGGIKVQAATNNQ